jgi:hypothetical protein
LTATGTLAESSDPHKIERGTLSITVPFSDDDDSSLRLAFDFLDTRAFDDSVKNADGSINAITTAPATKSGFVHLWLKSKKGDLMFINDVNGRVARLLKGQAAEWATGWLYASAISGRKVFLEAIEGESPGKRREYKFSITVGERGELSLASPVVLKAPSDH